MIKLVINTPDVISGEGKIEQEIVLSEDDCHGKTIQEVLICTAFKDVLKGVDAVSADQAFSLVFSMIQPVGIQNPAEWWHKPFMSLVQQPAKDPIVHIDLEFNIEGQNFIDENL